jgi:hypothetical protein
MPGKRPLGPVFRPFDDDQGDTMTTATAQLARRWDYLRDGATLGAMLTHLARTDDLTTLAVALGNLDRDQLEAAAMAMVLIHAEGAPMVDPDGRH